MNSNIIKNMAVSLSNQDVVTKNYIHAHAFSSADGVVSGDVVLRIDSDLLWILGRDNLSAGKKFILMLGSYSNMLTYSILNLFVLTPIELKTDAGFVILIDHMWFYSGFNIMQSTHRYESTFNEECEESG